MACSMLHAPTYSGPFFAAAAVPANPLSVRAITAVPARSSNLLVKRVIALSNQVVRFRCRPRVTSADCRTRDEGATLPPGCGGCHCESGNCPSGSQLTYPRTREYCTAGCDRAPAIRFGRRILVLTSELRRLLGDRG